MKAVYLHHIFQTRVSRFFTVSSFLYTLALSHVYFFVYYPFPGCAVVMMSHPCLEFLETVLRPWRWCDSLWNCCVTVFLCEWLKPVIGVYSRRFCTNALLFLTTPHICGSSLWNTVFLIWLLWWKMLLERFVLILLPFPWSMIIVRSYLELEAFCLPLIQMTPLSRVTYYFFFISFYTNQVRRSEQHLRCQQNVKNVISSKQVARSSIF